MKMMLGDELQVLLLLSFSLDSCDTLVVSLSNSTPQDVITLDRVNDNMFNEDIRKKPEYQLSPRPLLSNIM